MNGLTTKQKIFIAEYLKDFNGTRAAITAGYSKDSAAVIAHENLRKPNIVKEIRKAIEESTDIDLITLKHRISGELSRLAFSDDDIYAVYNKDGELSGYRFSDKIKALELLGKYVSMFTDKLEIEGNINLVSNGPEDDL